MGWLSKWNLLGGTLRWSCTIYLVHSYNFSVSRRSVAFSYVCKCVFGWKTASQLTEQAQGSWVFHFLCSCSNNVNVEDEDGNTALHVASLSSKTECMRVLIRAGGTESLGVGKFNLGPYFLSVLFYHFSLSKESTSGFSAVSWPEQLSACYIDNNHVFSFHWQRFHYSARSTTLHL